MNIFGTYAYAYFKYLLLKDMDVLISFFRKNRHKTQRKAKFYLNNWRSVFYMQGGLKQTLA